MGGGGTIDGFAAAGRCPGRGLGPAVAADFAGGGADGTAILRKIDTPFVAGIGFGGGLIAMRTGGLAGVGALVTMFRDTEVGGMDGGRAIDGPGVGEDRVAIAREERLEKEKPWPAVNDGMTGVAWGATIRVNVSLAEGTLRKPEWDGGATVGPSPPPSPLQDGPPPPMPRPDDLNSKSRDSPLQKPPKKPIFPHFLMKESTLDQRSFFVNGLI
jgi:hypothetical protein